MDTLFAEKQLEPSPKRVALSPSRPVSSALILLLYGSVFPGLGPWANPNTNGQKKSGHFSFNLWPAVLNIFNFHISCVCLLGMIFLTLIPTCTRKNYCLPSGVVKCPCPIQTSPTRVITNNHPRQMRMMCSINISVHPKKSVKHIFFENMFFKTWDIHHSTSHD